MKKKVLVVSEAHYLNSGFAQYYKKLLEYLWDSGKYEIAEFACYGSATDGRDRKAPWKFYPNAVETNDQRYPEYSASVLNQFGAWRFDRVVLDFKCDVCIDARDCTMFGYQINSPLRPYFHYIVIPTIDSFPQHQSWMNIYEQADAVFTYSEWALRELRKASNGINTQKCISPGIDFNVFKPFDREIHREKMGLSKDWQIIGSVMRNQSRKSIPELFRAFKIYIENNPKAYLYLHTTYPDKGWNIPSLLKEFGLSNRVLFTYICKVSKKPFISVWQDAITYSPYTNAITGVFPNTKLGLTQEQLNDIYNIFDLYCQPVTAGGFEIPLIEAGAAGIPIMATNNTAMTEIIHNLDGYPIKSAKTFREFHTGADRDYIDIDSLLNIWSKFFSLSETERIRKRLDTRTLTQKHYNWESLKYIDEYLDKVEPKHRWADQPRLHEIPDGLPSEEISDADFVKWLFAVVLNEPERAYSYQAHDMLKDLIYGFADNGGNISDFNRHKAYNIVLKYAQDKLICEQARCGLIKLQNEDYLEYANMKERL